MAAMMQPLCALLACAVAAEPQRMSTRGRWIVDEAGRVRIFHGFNDIAHAKGNTFLPLITTMESNLQKMERDGFNGFRMPMMWAAVNPAKGVYNTTYIKRMQAITENLWEHNMYSFLDMHQDVLSSVFHSYDGAPQWVVNMTKPRHAYPWPVKKLKGWAEGYVTEAVGQAFQEIYDNTHGGLDAWAGMWSAVAAEFKGSKHILGYELMNEPWAGDIYEHPLILTPGEAGRKNLLPAYDKITAKIREQDNDTIIFFEPVTWGMVLPGQDVPTGSGFDHVPGGAANQNKAVFSWHYYCWMLNSDYTNSSQGYPPVLRAECDRGLLPLVIDSVVKDVTRLGAGSFLTEFGALTPSASHPDAEGTEEIRAVLDAADRSLQSWTYWDIVGLTDSSFNLVDDRYTPFVRTYAQATAGEPVSMHFDTTTQKFDFVFKLDASITEPTVLAVPDRLYPKGFDCATQPQMKTAACGVGLLCLTPSAGTADGTEVHVTVSSK